MSLTMSVTSSIAFTNAKTRTLLNWSLSACTSSIVKPENPATDPDTSHSSTSSGRAGCGLAKAGFSGHPTGAHRAAERAADVDAAALGAATASREPGRELARQRPHRGAQLLELLAVGAEEVDAVAAGADGVPGDDLAAALLGGAAPGLGRHQGAEPVDVAPDLVALQPVGHLRCARTAAPDPGRLASGRRRGPRAPARAASAGGAARASGTPTSRRSRRRPRPPARAGRRRSRPPARGRASRRRPGPSRAGRAGRRCRCHRVSSTACGVPVPAGK